MKTIIYKTFAALLLSSTLLLSGNVIAGNTPGSTAPAPTAAASSNITVQVNTLVQNLGFKVGSITPMNDGSGNYLVTLANGGHVIYYPTIGIVAVQDLPQ
jgi:hypothetical protein